MKASEYAMEMTQALGVEVLVAKTVKDAVSGSDIIVTATMSNEPLVRADWVSAGTHITAVGSDSPEKQELETRVLGKSDKVVCDSVKQCALLGELHHALEDGTLSESDVHAELGEILLGRKTGRQNDDEITVCDLTGLAVQDVVTSQLVYERAVKRNIGSLIGV